MARHLADRLTQALGRAVIIDNRPGAGGMTVPNRLPRRRMMATTCSLRSRVS
ncbi:MAG: tripartite tricarboxylate transporter substrate binding protein, partial [Lautropia sp.]|nr:tripartite tricarboxylate transporter substrate binding protein [Lautropia sp.]